MIYSFTFGIVFIVSGILFFTGTALRWIKGWQQTSPEEKARIRILPLCRNFGMLIILAGVMFVTAGLLPEFREGMFRWVMIGWLVLCGLDLLYVQKSNRYIIADKQLEERQR